MKHGLSLTGISALAMALGLAVAPAGAADEGPRPGAPLQIAQASTAGAAVEVLRREPGDTLRLISTPLKSYSVYLINVSGYTVERVRVDSGTWLPGPGEGRTCESGNYDTCFANGKWSRIAMVTCGGEHTIEIQMRDQRGNRFGLTRPWRFTASCTAEGGAFGL